MKTLLSALVSLLLFAPAPAELVAHWPLDADPIDATGNGHDGEIVGGTVTFGHPGATTRTGGAAGFPNQGHIDVPYSPDLNPGEQAEDGAGSFSVAFWANPSATGGGAYRSPFTSREENATSVNGPMIYNDEFGNWAFWAGNYRLADQWIAYTGGPVTINQWTHVAITYEAETLTRKMYLNGEVAIDEVRGISANAVRGFHIGSGADFGTAFFWDGLLDDMGFWNHALSAGEIADIMANGIAGEPPHDPSLHVTNPLLLELTGAAQNFDIPLTNGGSANALNVTAATFSGGHASRFSLVSLPGAIAPGATGTLSIAFDPTGVTGPLDTVLTITSNDAVNPVLPVTLNGFIHDPKVEVTEIRISFGTVPKGGTAPVRTLSLKNLGATQPLNLLGITPTGPDAEFFIVGDIPAAVAPGATGVIEFTFDPLDTDGSYVSRVIIETDDQITPALTVVLHAEVPVDEPLVAWWPLDEDASDASGNGFDGAVLEPGTVSFGEPGAFAATGGAAEFAGGGHIDVPFDQRLNPTSFTMTLWARPAGAGGAYASPITSRIHGGGGETNGYIIYRTDSGLWAFWTGRGIVDWDTVAGPAVLVGEWTHLAISYEAATDTKTLWINGEVAAVDTEVSAPTQYTPNTSASLHIGAGDDNGLGFPFSGHLDDIGLYRKALSQSEIQDVITYGVGGTPPTPPTGDFSILFFTRGATETEATLVWSSAEGASYVVQRSTTLATNGWTDLTPAVPSGGATTTFTDTTLPANMSAVYYRVRLGP